MVKVRDLTTLRRASVNIEALEGACASSQAREAQVFAVRSDGTLHTRNLCPRSGEEDPACGNGNAALGALLAKRGMLAVGHTLALEQGHIVNRPSRILVQRQANVEGQIAIAVGGHFTLMAEGHLLV
jgi:trans-2,3-dihydro-3-hydroxyanthranilate isomerase